ncbi:MAG: SUMF1/EgtB/PvdO family nonheme iron enzyme [Deltaproteobacteria bacterium]|nr:SUMF1/EgtB/PvdO family nonheme iron enzyme [Deltaproteobacteria bacterium]
MPSPVRARIEKLLSQADADIKAGRLGGPGQDNALARYREVSVLDPGNIDADEGLGRIVARCLVLAEKSARAGNLGQAKSYLDIADEALSGDERVAELRAKLPALAQAGPKESGPQAEVVLAKPSPPPASSSGPALAEPSPPPASSGGPVLAKEEDIKPSEPAGTQPEPEPGPDRLQGERLLQMAVAALAQGRLEEARAALEQARQVIPDDPTLALTARRLAEAEKAQKAEAETKLAQAEAAYEARELDQAGRLVDEAARVLGWSGRTAALKANIEAKRRLGVGPGSDKEFVNSIGLKFLLVPAGKFWMGSELKLNAPDNETPRHQVEITKPFWLSVFEVNQAQWTAIMGHNPSHFQDKDGLRPVENVTWQDVQKFIDRLNDKEFSHKYRLPTEAEWEYACRAGTQTSYSFGDDPTLLVQYGWYIGASGFRTHPVGQKKPNPWGFYDMHGNVWELCGDWYDKNYYDRSPVQDPQGPDQGQAKVMRGGSWLNGPGAERCPVRAPSKRNFSVGFRLAATK